MEFGVAIFPTRRSSSAGLGPVDRDLDAWESAIAEFTGASPTGA